MVVDKVGRKYFFGAFWMVILRVPRIRGAGLKYLTKELKHKGPTSIHADTFVQSEDIINEKGSSKENSDDRLKSNSKDKEGS